MTTISGLMTKSHKYLLDILIPIDLSIGPLITAGPIESLTASQVWLTKLLLFNLAIICFKRHVTIPKTFNTDPHSRTVTLCLRRSWGLQNSHCLAAFSHGEIIVHSCWIVQGNKNRAICTFTTSSSFFILFLRVIHRSAGALQPNPTVLFLSLLFQAPLHPPGERQHQRVAFKCNRKAAMTAHQLLPICLAEPPKWIDKVTCLSACTFFSLFNSIWFNLSVSFSTYFNIT